MEINNIHDEYGNPLDEKSLYRDDCMACREEIPFKWLPREKRFVHLDLFATSEYGTIFDCPVLEEFDGDK